MKVTKITTTTNEENLEITGATLLSIDEAEALPIALRSYESDWWWLRSPGRGHHYHNYAAIVFDDGYIHDSGGSVDNKNGVRPALKVKNLDASNLKVGDRFIFGKRQFEIISDTMAFCVEDIGECAFRTDWRAEDANDYEKSDVKKFVDEWFKEWSK